MRESPKSDTLATRADQPTLNAPFPGPAGRARHCPGSEGRRTLLRSALAGSVALLAPLTASARTEVPRATLDEAARAVAEGGYILVMRHARTVPGGGDPPGFRLGDCSTQRNLSDEGRAQSRALGAALRDAGVEIGAVRSSQWCRCLDTAELAFGKAEPFPPLNSFFNDRSTADAQIAALREAAAAFRGPANEVWVTHQVVVTALTGVFPAQGEFVVIRDTGGGLQSTMRVMI